MLREVLAPNASPMTLDGTRTYLVGNARVAVIDPGPGDPGHLDRLTALIGEASCVGVVVTHTHADHAAGAPGLAARLGATAGSRGEGTLADGDRIDTDAGPLIAVATPGHTQDHTAFHWPAAGAVFCGDLMMGGLDTALVAPPEGDLADYLLSLERIRDLNPRIIYPAHGPSFESAHAAIDSYISHRRDRERQVLESLAAGADDVEAIVERVYGPGLPPEFRGVARGAVHAYLDHLEKHGRLPRLRIGGRSPAGTEQ
jgi:glyoxylase-like metal-dependent hydrolase (beta-lactamase superfamily II)